MTPSSERWPAWLWIRFVVLVAASILMLVLLLDNDIVVTSWEWKTGTGARVMSYEHSLTCRKIKGEGFEKQYCLYETESDNTKHVLGFDPSEYDDVDEFEGLVDGKGTGGNPETSDAHTSGTYKCKDLIKKNDDGGGFFTFRPLNSPPLLQNDIEDVCCDNMGEAHKMLIASTSFALAALVASLLPIFGALTSIVPYACLVFVAVAVGLLGPALTLSDTNGPITCNDDWNEAMRLNVTAGQNILNGDEADILINDFGYGTSEEQREDGFWLMLAATVILGTLLLVEIIMLASNYFKSPPSRSNAPPPYDVEDSKGFYFPGKKIGELFF